MILEVLPTPLSYLFISLATWAFGVVLALGIIKGFDADVPESVYVCITFWPLSLAAGLVMAPFWVVYKLTAIITKRVRTWKTA